MTAAIVHIPHKHAADQSNIEATKVRADLLERAATSYDRPRHTYLEPVDPSAVQQLDNSRLSLRLRLRRQTPQFPPITWNVFDATVSHQQRTNNDTEAWNHAFAGQVGHSHPSLYRLIDNLRKDNALVVVALEAESRGQPPRKRVRRATRDLQERLFNLCVARRDAQKSVPEFLRGVGHAIRFV